MLLPNKDVSWVSNQQICPTNYVNLPQCRGPILAPSLRRVGFHARLPLGFSLTPGDLKVIHRCGVLAAEIRAGHYQDSYQETPARSHGLTKTLRDWASYRSYSL
jgi:hypothetical protein